MVAPFLAVQNLYAFSYYNICLFKKSMHFAHWIGFLHKLQTECSLNYFY